jgi:hexokinase
MQDIPNNIRKLRAAFVLSEDQIKDIAGEFQKSMAHGIQGKESPLKMLPTFLTIPTGEERGIYLTVDFGGTNVRILLVELKGHGDYHILDRYVFPLTSARKDYDFTSEKANGTELFEFIAEQISNLIPTGSDYPLGFTFSFPSRQNKVDQATLIKWTKEIKTSGVQGRDVSQIFQKALLQKGLNGIKIRAVINDTVGTLLTAAYGDKYTDIGSICGTGHNTCYLEPRSPVTGEQMIINMESGNFNVLPFTGYDSWLDQQSEIPGEQCLEKMVSGKYIGELTRFIIRDFIEKGLIFKGSCPEIFFSPYVYKAEDVSTFLEDKGEDLPLIAEWLNTAGISESLLEERVTLKTIASIVVTRSIQLVAATYLGVLQHIDPHFNEKHTIAIDGSLYEHIPGYATMLRATMNNLLRDKPGQAGTKLTKEGSGVGAAVAAALVQ